MPAKRRGFAGERRTSLKLFTHQRGDRVGTTMIEKFSEGRCERTRRQRARHPCRPAGRTASAGARRSEFTQRPSNAMFDFIERLFGHARTGHDAIQIQAKRIGYRASGVTAGRGRAVSRPATYRETTESRPQFLDR